MDRANLKGVLLLISSNCIYINLEVSENTKLIQLQNIKNEMDKKLCLQTEQF